MQNKKHLAAWAVGHPWVPPTHPWDPRWVGGTPGKMAQIEPVKVAVLGRAPTG